MVWDGWSVCSRDLNSILRSLTSITRLGYAEKEESKIGDSIHENEQEKEQEQGEDHFHEQDQLNYQTQQQGQDQEQEKDQQLEEHKDQ